jgi:hypothetical protein
MCNVPIKPSQTIQLGVELPHAQSQIAHFQFFSCEKNLIFKDMQTFACEGHLVEKKLQGWSSYLKSIEKQ